jgi:hypothetical protein
MGIQTKTPPHSFRPSPATCQTMYSGKKGRVDFLPLPRVNQVQVRAFSLSNLSKSTSPLPSPSLSLERKSASFFQVQKAFIQPSSSPLIKKPARPLIPTSTAIHSALLALHPTRLQAGESRHASSLARGTSIGASTAAQRFGDAAEGVVGEVGLGRSAGGRRRAAEAARGALFGGLEAFFDGEELGFESGWRKECVLVRFSTCGWQP